MSLKIHPIQRKILAGDDKDMIKWFGQVRQSGKVPFDKLCEKIANLSTATKGDVEVVLKSMVLVLCEQLSNGNIVQVKGLGNFRVSAGSKGVDEPEDFHVSMMCRKKVVFYPGPRLQRLRNETKFVQLTVKDAVKEECELEHIP